MTLERLKSLGEVGVDYVSFGGVHPRTVKAFDFSLKEESCE